MGLLPSLLVLPTENVGLGAPSSPASSAPVCRVPTDFARRAWGEEAMSAARSFAAANLRVCSLEMVCCLYIVPIRFSSSSSHLAAAQRITLLMVYGHEGTEMGVVHVRNKLLSSLILPEHTFVCLIKTLALHTAPTADLTPRPAACAPVSATGRPGSALWGCALVRAQPRHPRPCFGLSRLVLGAALHCVRAAGTGFQGRYVGATAWVPGTRRRSCRPVEARHITISWCTKSQEPLS